MEFPVGVEIYEPSSQARSEEPVSRSRGRPGAHPGRSGLSEIPKCAAGHLVPLEVLDRSQAEVLDVELR